MSLCGSFCDRRLGIQRSRRIEARPALTGINGLERNAVKTYLAFLETNTSITATSIEPWVNLVEAMRRAWGDCKAIDRIAFFGAGIRSKSVVGIDVRLKDAPDLVNAARFARLKLGAPRWWEDRLKSERDPAQRRRLLLLLFMWATPKTLIKLSDFLHEFFATETERNWLDLNRDLYFLAPLLEEREELSGIRDHDVAIIGKLGPRVSVFIGQRLSPKSQFDLALTLVSREAQLQAPEMQFALKALLMPPRGPTKWKAILPHVKYLYMNGASVNRVFPSNVRMPESVAKQVSADPNSFPLPLVTIADNRLLSSAGTKAAKLLEVAQREKWFSN